MQVNIRQAENSGERIPLEHLGLLRKESDGRGIPCGDLENIRKFKDSLAGHCLESYPLSRWAARLTSLIFLLGALPCFREAYLVLLGMAA